MKKSELRQLIREEVQNAINPPTLQTEGFGFWFREGKKGLEQAKTAKEILKKNNVNFKTVKNPYAIMFSGEENTLQQIKKLMLSNGITRYIILND